MVVGANEELVVKFSEDVVLEESGVGGGEPFSTKRTRKAHAAVGLSWSRRGIGTGPVAMPVGLFGGDGSEGEWSGDDHGAEIGDCAKGRPGFRRFRRGYGHTPGSRAMQTWTWPLIWRRRLAHLADLGGFVGEDGAAGHDDEVVAGAARTGPAARIAARRPDIRGFTHGARSFLSWAGGG